MVILEFELLRVGGDGCQEVEERRQSVDSMSMLELEDEEAFRKEWSMRPRLRGINTAEKGR